MVNGIGRTAFGAVGSGGTEAQLAQGRQIGREPGCPKPFPESAGRALLCGPAGPVTEPTQPALANQSPEDLGRLHHRGAVFGGCGIGAENML